MQENVAIFSRVYVGTAAVTRLVMIKLLPYLLILPESGIFCFCFAVRVSTHRTSVGHLWHNHGWIEWPGNDHGKNSL